jgi:uncharacterized YceG family protein
MAVGAPLREPPSRGRIWARRVIALGVLVLLLGGAAALVLTIRGGDAAPPPPTTTAPPPPKPLRIVFPEGFTIDQMAERITAVNQIAWRKRHVRPKLSAARYERLTRNAGFPPGFGGRRGRLEGFLFPATYDFTKRTTTAQLVKAQLAAFTKNWKGVDLRYARSKNLTPYEVLIIASMVEREAAVASERPLVASVIYNRLAAGMPLGIDATIRYGLDVPGTESLHESQLNTDSPYNTRLRTGLPPTPIGNPGLASIRAAAHPRKTRYLFFVRKRDSLRHFFTASESEFYRKQCEYGFGCG